MRVELGHKDAIGSAGRILVVQEADARLGSAVMVRSDRARCHETEGVATDYYRDQGDSWDWLPAWTVSVSDTRHLSLRKRTHRTMSGPANQPHHLPV